MSIETAIVRRASNKVDRPELGRTVGVSPGKGELVLKHYQAGHEPSWFMLYSKWSRLGPTAAGPARPVEHKSEDQRDIAFDRIGAVLVGAAIVLAVPKFWLWSALAFVAGVCAVGYHYYSVLRGIRGTRPPMPVYAILPQQGTQAHRLVETIHTEMTPVVHGGVVLLDEKSTKADGRLELHVRQRDTKSDEKRSRVYARRFSSLRDEDISLGYIGFDRSPAVKWALPADVKQPSLGLSIASPRVLQLKAPFAASDRKRLFPSGPTQSQPWAYAAGFSIEQPLEKCPSVSASAMIDPSSAGNTLRLTITRAVDDRSPDTRVRFAGISGQVRLSVGGSFRRPGVELHRGSKHGDNRGPSSPSTEDDPQKHAPEFALKFSDNDEFMSGDSLTVYLIFEKPIQAHETDAIWFVAYFDFLDPVSGYHQLALFDPLGNPISDRYGSTSEAKGARPVFMEPSYRESSVTVHGVLPLARLLVVAEDTQKAIVMQPGRLPTSELVHELISSLVSEHRLALRDVREDYAERNAADRGALVWTILAKDSENMLSPDVTIRIAGARVPGTGQEATSLEISVISKYSNPDEFRAVQQLKTAITEGADAIVRSFVARRAADEATSAADARHADEGLVAFDRSADGSASARLDQVVMRAERLIERFERIFKPS